MYRILPVVTCGCETLSLTLRDIEGIREKGVEENIWTEKGRSNRRLGKLHNEVFYNF
jgi:hypothetical protein